MDGTHGWPWRPLGEALWSEGSIDRYVSRSREGDRGLSKNLGFEGVEVDGVGAGA
jgi:hypothetical protein